MNIWHDISKERIKKDDFIAVIEISKGSRKKYELDKETGMLVYDRLLKTATRYPSNYGFIPRTLSLDGDALDVLVLCSEIEPFVLVRCVPIGVIKMIDNGKCDEKIIAVPMGDTRYNFKDATELPVHMVEEIEHFLSIYKALDRTPVEVSLMKGREEAMKIIDESLKRYDQEFSKK
ncbi:MAG: inorganic diphosphatase [Firmicutes bacterium]|nr:inorganic diphosphatase [Bacillota bacterium]